MTFEVARTPAALFRQLRAQERDLAELELVRRAYDLGVTVYSGRFEVDGAPFSVHGLGTASVMGQLGAPSQFVAMATVHNAYGSGDWGDGRGPGPHPNRRALVQAQLGADVDALMMAFAADDPSVTDDPVDDTHRWIALLHLADLLDKWEDGRVAYSLDGRQDRAYVEANKPALLAQAARLGGPDFAEALRGAIARSEAEDIPTSLKPGRRNSVVVLPPSARLSTRVLAMQTARRVGRRVRRLLRAGS